MNKNMNYLKRFVEDESNSIESYKAGIQDVFESLRELLPQTDLEKLCQHMGINNPEDVNDLLNKPDIIWTHQK